VLLRPIRSRERAILRDRTLELRLWILRQELKTGYEALEGQKYRFDWETTAIERLLSVHSKNQRRGLYAEKDGREDNR